MGLADLTPGAEPLRRRRLLQRQGGRRRGGPASARRALRLVQSLDDRDLRRGSDGRQQLAHGVEVAKRLARFHFSRKVRRAVAGVQRQRDEAPCLAQLRVVAEEIVPLIEQGLQQSVDVQLAARIVPTLRTRTPGRRPRTPGCRPRTRGGRRMRGRRPRVRGRPARMRAGGPRTDMRTDPRPTRVVAPVGAVAVAHVPRDIGCEPHAQRLQARFDPLLGREGGSRPVRSVHTADSISNNAMRSP